MIENDLLFFLEIDPESTYIFEGKVSIKIVFCKRLEVGYRRYSMMSKG